MTKLGYYVIASERMGVVQINQHILSNNKIQDARKGPRGKRVSAKHHQQLRQTGQERPRRMRCLESKDGRGVIFSQGTVHLLGSWDVGNEEEALRMVNGRASLQEPAYAHTGRSSR